MKLTKLCELYRDSRLGLKEKSYEQIVYAVRSLNQHASTELHLKDLSKPLIVAWMRQLLECGKSPVTVNRRRTHILTLWKYAAEEERISSDPPRTIPKATVPKLIPSSWTMEELSKILAACDTAPTFSGWGPAHWRALVLTIYDTSLRVGCLFKVKIDAFDPHNHTIAVDAIHQKGNASTFQKISPETAAALTQITADRNSSALLFDWTGGGQRKYNSSIVQRRFRLDVLKPAGLPATRRDCFHKIRRTSYTIIADRLGIAEASKHAGHKHDMSSYYLDTSKTTQSNAVDHLPRPG